MMSEPDNRGTNEAGANASMGILWRRANTPLIAQVVGGGFVALVVAGFTAQLPAWASAAGILAIIFCVASLYYSSVLACSVSTLSKHERRPYQRLRSRLIAGGDTAKSYDAAVIVILSWVARAMGDGNRGDSCWTTSSFDRCLLIASAYPIFTITLGWFVFGIVDTTELALQFPENIPAWRRLLGGISFSIFLYLTVRLTIAFVFEASGDSLFPKPTRTAIAIATSSVLLFIIARGLTAAHSLTWAIGVILAITPGMGFIAARAAAPIGPLGGALAIAVTTSFAASEAIVSERFPAIVFLVATGITMTGLTLIINLIKDTVYLGSYQALIFITTIGFCLLLLGHANNQNGAVLILFMPLLTLINAPFDWLSFGLTRFLLRKNLELGGWWAIGLAAIDLLGALVLLMILALAILLTVQCANALTSLNELNPIIDPSRIIINMQDNKHRWNPQFWWLYIMLFSTLLPSLINFFIGTLSVFRGYRPLNSWIVRQMPARRNMTSLSRLWLPPILATQFMGSALISFAILASGLWLLINGILPIFGMTVFEMLSNVEQINLPAKIILR